MKLSFKYKFIVSFVTIEVIFISLIVFFNFSSLSKLSSSLIEEKVETGTRLFTELVKTPLIVYDLGTVDNAVESLIRVKNIAAVQVVDAEGNTVSWRTFDEDLKLQVLHENRRITFKERELLMVSEPINAADTVLGHADIAFDLTESLQTLADNRQRTFIVILFEILISLIVAYLVGYKLTRALTRLTEAAGKISGDRTVKIPDVGSPGDEMAILSQAMGIMQERIEEHSQKLKGTIAELNTLTLQLQKERDFHAALLNTASSVIAVMDRSGKIVSVNEAVLRITGYKKSELEGQKIWQVLIPHALRDRIQEYFGSLVAGDFPSSYQNEWLTKFGERVPFVWSNSCTVDTQGEVEYIIAVGIDMTELKHSEQTIRALINSPLDAMTLLSIDGKIMEINSVGAEALGTTVEVLKGEDLSEYLPPKLLQDRSRYFYEVITQKEPVEFEERYEGRFLNHHLYPIEDVNGTVMQVSLFSRDVTQLRLTQKKLERYMELVNENVITSKTNKKGIITEVSDAFCRISEYSREELVGKAHNIVRHPDMPASLFSEMWERIKQGQTWRGEIKNRKKSGGFYWVEVMIFPEKDEEGEIIGYNAIRHDISDKKLVEALSVTDPLTKLYNRRHFDKLFATELNRVKRERQLFCLLLMDVDNFKLYNDTYGHPAGDAVLEMIGRVLQETIRRAGDFAFRLGGEEFGVIYSVNDADAAAGVAEKIRAAIESEAVEHKKNTASPYVTASFGVVYIDFSAHSQAVGDMEDLYKSADGELYEAKESGRNRVVMQEYAAGEAQ